MRIGSLQKQPSNYSAFIPDKFPPAEPLVLSPHTHQLNADAMRLLGKLDGITKLLPDLNFFVLMFYRKEAAASSQIEGTQATLTDAIYADAGVEKKLPADVSDIVHYVAAMEHGLKRLSDLPLSLRLIREVHGVLMQDARSTQFADPGEFRRSQNWIGGTTPNNASFVPPPPNELARCLDDFEKFLHAKDTYLPLVQTAIMHAQFETIHPFLDGNGRTGRLLITFYLVFLGILERPVLYLSSFFHQHRQLYYDRLSGYHDRGDVSSWIDFFLEGVVTVATAAIETSRVITEIRERDLARIQTLGRRAEVGATVLKHLFSVPAINVRQVEKWTGLSRPSANSLVKELVTLGILEQEDEAKEYARVFLYKEYLNAFTREL